MEQRHARHPDMVEAGGSSPPEITVGLEVFWPHAALVARKTGSDSRPDLSTTPGTHVPRLGEFPLQGNWKGSIPFVSTDTEGSRIRFAGAVR